MGLWSSLVGGVKSLGSSISTGAKWVWNNASLAKISWGVFTYSADTVVQLLKQGLALRKAIPTLIHNAEARKVASGLTHVFLWDVLPVLAMTYLNSTAQAYMNEGDDPDSGHALLDYPVMLMALYFGIESMGRMGILDSVGPGAFNSNKEILPPSDCTNQCNFKRKAKGMIIREPQILMANDFLVAGISTYSPLTARILDLLFKGRYITRLVTPERCERHKAMDSASVLALGLSFEGSKILMDHVLTRYIGLPTDALSKLLYYPIYRTMEHMLLLFHINLDAHMNLPVAKNKSISSYDPLTLWEGFVRFIVDVQIAGLMKRIPIDLKPEKNKPPLIPLAPVLQGITRIVNSDLEKETRVNPGACRQFFNRLSFVIPPMYRSVDGFLNDAIVTMYWPEIRKGGMYAADIVLSIGNSKMVAVVAWAPKSVASAVHLFTGLPKKAIQIILELTQEKDLHDLAKALKLWFERHAGTGNSILMEQPGTIVLLGDKPLLSVPDTADLPEVAPVRDLLTHRSSESPVSTVSMLMPIDRKRKKETGNPAEAKLSLVAVRDEAPVSSPKDLMPLPRKGLKEETSITANANTLFTLRQRKKQPVVAMPRAASASFT